MRGLPPQPIALRNDGREFKRVMSKVLIGDGCWEWQAYRTPLGYGRVCIGRKLVLAHRVVYLLLEGPIPEGLTLDHLCRNTGCVRPDHMEPVPVATNILRSNSLSAVNARKTVCNRGHALTPDNTLLRPGGGRECRTCRRFLLRERYYKRVGHRPDPLPTHCPNGHEFTSENTYRRVGGGRRCRTCQREYFRAWEARRRATA